MYGSACVTLNLYRLASGLVAKNRALGLQPHVIFLKTQPEPHVYKSNVTHRAIHFNYYLFTACAALGTEVQLKHKLSEATGTSIDVR